MNKNVDQLYHAAIAKLTASADPQIEELRLSVARGEGIPIDPSPQALAQQANKNTEWGEYAFGELRKFGFVRARITKLEWYRPTDTELWEEQAALAGIETTAIVRLSSMDLTPALPELEHRLHEFKQLASSGEVLPSLLAHQKMMMTLVAAIGETHTLEEYAKRASVALIYTRSQRVRERHLKGMLASSKTMLSYLSDVEARTSAAAAVAMRIHPAIPLVTDGVAS